MSLTDAALIILGFAILCVTAWWAAPAASEVVGEVARLLVRSW